MNDRISEFLKYLKIEKNYSSNTIKNYEIDIDEFKNYLNCEGIDYLSVDYDFITCIISASVHTMYFRGSVYGALS